MSFVCLGETQEVPSVKFLTLIFVTLIFFAATQDIAVDGWALTLLSQENLSYASTAQTIGLNSGYFLSFTVSLCSENTGVDSELIRLLLLLVRVDRCSSRSTLSSLGTSTSAPRHSTPR